MLAVAVPVGILLGWAAGGSIHGLATVRLTHERAIVLLFVIQGVLRGRLAGASPTESGLLAWALISAALVALLLVHRLSPGLLMVAAGIALNLFVVLLNQGMPVRVAPGRIVEGVQRTSAGFYQLAREDTLAGWLGDVLPLQVGQVSLMLSLGDLLLCVGAIVFIVDAMRPMASGLSKERCSEAA